VCDANAAYADRFSAFARTVFAPNGEILCVGNWREDLIVWNPTTGLKNIRKSNPLLPMSKIFKICLLPDGALFASTYDREVALWVRGSMERITRLAGHTDQISAFAFSPGGKTLASGGSRGSIKLWDIASGEELLTLEGHTGSVSLMQFSPDGKILATCADRPNGTSEIFLWHTAEDETEPAAPGQSPSTDTTQ
jgi:WD40 repeat protein